MIDHVLTGIGSIDGKGKWNYLSRNLLSPRQSRHGAPEHCLNSKLRPDPTPLTMTTELSTATCNGSATATNLPKRFIWQSLRHSTANQWQQPQYSILSRGCCHWLAVQCRRGFQHWCNRNIGRRMGRTSHGLATPTTRNMFRFHRTSWEWHILNKVFHHPIYRLRRTNPIGYSSTLTQTSFSHFLFLINDAVNGSPSSPATLVLTRLLPACVTQLHDDA